MNENRFPHLTQYEHPHSELYTSQEVNDGDPDCPSVLDYQVDTNDKDITLAINDGDDDYACFILNKDHIPFLEQLLSDLKEVTKDE
ncbi:hypothetical protein FINN_43 [Bacillus phage Finn]|uniref:Uncharacterized protein n=1 Tax=Bacillus phage Finn TaxID=2884419 RepID=M1IEY0_9CAUD|nr:hypothetical protein FINN_43 [Bacillus phage Finn]AGE61036.1 hypothetical protein FINN_43 [Bacillus phage Finn]